MTQNNKWEKDVTEGEKIELDFGISAAYSKSCIIASIVLGLLLMYPYGEGIVIIIGGILFFGFHERKANNYALTNKRILIKQGLLHNSTTSVEYHQITDITISEPFFERFITGSGTIAINTAGSSVAEAHLKHVANPQEIKKKIFEFKGLSINKETDNTATKKSV